MLEKYLNLIAHADPSQRRDNLRHALDEIGISYQEDAITDDIVNIHVPLHEANTPRIIIGAHYDNTQNSPSANKNSSSVAIVLGLIRVFYFIYSKKKRPLPLEFVFFDGHYQDFTGSQAFAQKTDPQQVHLMINLDMCGIGDTVMLASEGEITGTVAEKAIRRLADSPYQSSLRLVDILPPSDNTPFTTQNIPTAHICIVPEEDILPMIGIAVSLHNQEKIAVLPSIYQSVQNPAFDTTDTVDVDAMRQVMLVVNTLMSNVLNLVASDWK